MSRTHSKWFVWFLCIALVVMRVGAVHVHFCADGNEPAASVHVGDSGIHDLDHPKVKSGAAPLSDSDVSVPGDALVKSFDGALDMPALAVTLTLVLFLVAVVRSVTVDRGPLLVRISDPTVLRPPLRGPPV